jgi:hypothetical protein
MSIYKVCIFSIYAIAFIFLSTYINCFYNSIQSYESDEPTYWVWITNINIRSDTTISKEFMIRVLERFYVGYESKKQINNLFRTKKCANKSPLPYLARLSDSLCFETKLTLYNNSIWE